MPENDVIEYKCPNCGGGLKFDSKSQNMSCPYCGTEFDVEAVKEYANEAKKAETDSIEWETYDENSGSGDWTAEEREGLRLYVCQSCGGELECDETQSATFCPYCGNPVIMSDRVSSGFKPDIVIPFKKTKEDAKNSFFQFIKIPVIREDDDGAVTDLEVFRTDLRSFVRYIFDLTAESLRVDDSTVPQYVYDVRTKNAGGKQVQGKFPEFIHHGMPCVVSALIADHNVIIFGDQVDHAAFSFITPVHSNDSTDCHSSSKYYWFKLPLNFTIRGSETVRLRDEK